MGGRLAESASEKRIEENGREPEALPLNSSQAMSDQRRHNSADTSGDDGKPQRTGLDLSREDQLTTFAVTPRVEAAADEPYHVFGKHVKYLTVILISVAGNFSGLSSSTYFPALKTITKEFGISHQVASLTITSYQIMQGIGPLLWGTLSDKLGRRQAYVYCFTVYIIANIVLSFSPNMPVMFVFRGFQSLSSASLISIGSGVIQDIAPPVELGGLMSVYQTLRMSSLTVGPVIGGALDQRFGFRSTFMTLAILSGLVFIIIIVLLPETLRSVAGNGSVRLKGLRYRPLWGVMAGKQTAPTSSDQVMTPKIRLRDFLGPLRMLGDKDTLLNLFLGAVVYSVWSMMTGTMTMLLEEKFDLSELEIGLAYLPNGFGTCLGSIAAGWLMNRDYRSTEASYKQSQGMSEESKISPKATPSDFPIEKARLRQVFWIIGMQSLSLALYGVAFLDLPITSRRGWIAVLLTLQFFIAAFANMIFAINSCLITDLYPGKGASATSINNLARCSMSAGAIPLAHYMIKAIGAMPAFCTFGGIVLALCVPAAIVSRTQGMVWRRERMEKARSREDKSQNLTVA